METLAKQALFWDIDTKMLDPRTHQRFIIERILARGDIDDVLWAQKQYGNKSLKEAFIEAKNLDAKSFAFWNYYFFHDTVCTQKPLLRKQSAFWNR